MRTRSAIMYAPCSSQSGASSANSSPPTRAAESKLRFAARNAPTHPPERLVALRPAPLGVHAREPVQVPHHEAQRRVAPAGPLQLGVEGVLEAAAVEQLGERVVIRHLPEAPDGAHEAVAEQGHEHARHQQRAHRGHPAVHERPAVVLGREHDRVRRGDQRHVHERRAAAGRSRRRTASPRGRAGARRRSRSPRRTRRRRPARCPPPPRRGSPARVSGPGPRTTPFPGPRRARPPKHQQILVAHRGVGQGGGHEREQGTEAAEDRPRTRHARHRTPHRPS